MSLEFLTPQPPAIIQQTHAESAFTFQPDLPSTALGLCVDHLA